MEGVEGYVYGMRSRGISPGSQPKGFIGHRDMDKKETGYWSLVQYKNELTEEQVRNYELVPLGKGSLKEIL